ncbi:MAG TPA: ABC transporter permease [Lachnospiraceae bacterium]|jgi:peptide/nickel transport system permease protein|nr:ABC transporter permease [Lachnospiraceae bacterium]
MKYAVKKLTTLILTLLLVSFLAFLAFQVIPGDPAIKMLGTKATPNKLAALREEMGLNRPMLIRYFTWLKDFFFGNMGTSYSYHMPVDSMLSGKLPITLTLTGISFLMIVAGSIPLGIYTAKYQDRRLTKALNVLNQITMSIPPFFVGVLFTYFFGLLLRWFTPGGFVSYTTNVFKFVGYLIFPAISIALPKIAMSTKMLQGSLMTEMQKDYVRTAYSRGNRTKGVLYHHVLKNAMIPVITFLGMTLADIVAGSIIIEQVFSIPGLGRLLITSIANRDYPVVQAIIMCIAFIVIIINFAVDILYQIIDPRVRGQ